MTAPLLLSLGAAAGAAVAVAAGRGLRRSHRPLSNRYFAALATFAAGAVVPAGAVFLFSFPDWAFMYVVDPAHVPRIWTALALLAGYGLCPVLGFWSAARAMAARSRWPLRIARFGPLFLACAVLVLGRSRLARVGYYGSYHYGEGGVSLFESSLALPLALASLALVAAFVFTLDRIRRHLDLVEMR